jgi:hypothetical protein
MAQETPGKPDAGKLSDGSESEEVKSEKNGKAHDEEN